MNSLVLSKSLDAAYNLALEQALLETELPLLYLWRNRDIVVIGKNQNAFAETDLDVMAREGISLARRTTGGGAVFHDDSNLNYSFIMPNAVFDIDRQFSVIQRAVAMFGINAVRSGRNDLTAGAKFSGSAFHHGKRTSLHHGTLLLDTDMKKLAACLRPSEDKLRSKGVKSVRSRVVNLRELNDDINVHTMTNAVAAAFASEYGACSVMTELALPDCSELAAKFRSDEWLYGGIASYEKRLFLRLERCEAELLYDVCENKVTRCVCHTDSLDVSFPDRVRQATVGADEGSLAEILKKCE